MFWLLVVNFNCKSVDKREDMQKPFLVKEDSTLMALCVNHITMHQSVPIKFTSSNVAFLDT